MNLGRLLACLALCTTAATIQAAEPLRMSQNAAKIERDIDWSKARLIAVQDANRYKTLDSFARESMHNMTGAEHLPGLTPMASLCEWLFNRDAYADVPLVKIKDKGLQIHFTAHMTEAERQRILRDGTLTPRELSDPVVMQRISELEPRFEMVSAIRRVRNAEAVAKFIERTINIVPQPGGDAVAAWHTPNELLANAPAAIIQASGTTLQQLEQKLGPLTPIANMSEQQALSVLAPWVALRAAWLSGDVPKVQENLDKLADVLPTLAAADVYPAKSQRSAEAIYYRLNKFTYGWILYLIGAVVAVWAVVTPWRTPWYASLGLLVLALAFHAVGLGLRWYILGRIPVANMFEAIVGSAWAGIALALVVELVFRTRVFLLAAHVTGFFALIIAGFVLPGGGTITSIMGILDDIMLRIHTVCIIASYALIFLASVIGVMYLIGYYYHVGFRRTAPAPQHGLALAGVGAFGQAPLHMQRPIMAGGAPGDERSSKNLPAWLNHFDWSHLIILNIVFVVLFIGVVLGAVWADYSWGRPWGWDPKEVFAMNTWIIYAILIHTRFIVADRGLWTAWLSVAGCIMMAFNWCVVNFFIVGLHSYA